MIHARWNIAGAFFFVAALGIAPAFASDPDHATATETVPAAAEAQTHGADPAAQTHAAGETPVDPAATHAATASDPAATHESPPASHDPAAAAHTSPNLFTVEPGLMIWTIVTFLVVLAILQATAWKPIMTALKERESKIEGAIAEASRIKNEAEQLHAKYLTLLDRAKDDARSILDEARRDGIALQEDLRNRAKQEAEEFKTRAHREIELQKDSAIKEIWDQTAGLATLLASRVLGRSLQGADQERLVRELLAGMQEETSATSASGRGSERRA